MGLLDDAIREHLELKRRHGAAEDDVARQEQEALGPPRRGEVPEPLSPAGDQVEVEPEVEASEPGELAAPAEGADDGSVAAYAAPPAEPAPPQASVYADEPWLEEADPAPPAAPPEADAEEDVLEETPEFLQETPEHDRLWFEQKPPKDFNFDK